jgi:hypothetical protein
MGTLNLLVINMTYMETWLSFILSALAVMASGGIVRIAGR